MRNLLISRERRVVRTRLRRGRDLQHAAEAVAAVIDFRTMADIGSYTGPMKTATRSRSLSRTPSKCYCRRPGVVMVRLGSPARRTSEPPRTHPKVVRIAPWGPAASASIAGSTSAAPGFRDEVVKTD